MIHVAVMGATGYAGAELVSLLLKHPDARIVWLGSKSHAGERYADIYRNFEGLIDETCREDDLPGMAECADVIFTATPQGYLSGVIGKEILEKARVIDLSADFRLADAATYEAWYHIRHGAPGLIAEAVYGLCEIRREEIRKARLIANPGCYTTCAILTCFPAVKEGLIHPDSLIVDALSGISGAGRGAKTDNLFCEVNESCKPYGVTTHRHTVEIEEQLSFAAGRKLTLTFTPHLVPMNRGILATCYADLARETDEEEVRGIYQAFYRDEPFVRVLPGGRFPETRYVARSNRVDLQVAVDRRNRRLIMTGALDNLVKGAAGQAVQNMNLVCGIEETTGLCDPPAFL
ncbi:MAG: N-acetyl-gamma-glutamyl-phosphate reductase [Lachnospiraceae bacterium]|nr:N-acetyl-gamma-glutamyl-phosphate reductase [Lachnospiraceae bacterium]